MKWRTAARVWPAFLLFAACAGSRATAPAPTPPPARPEQPRAASNEEAERAVGEWVGRCRERLERARDQAVASAPSLANAQLKVDGGFWNPALRLEVVEAGSSRYSASVILGEHPCTDFDDDRLWVDAPWSDGTPYQGTVSRVRRVAMNNASVSMPASPRDVAATVRAAFEPALEACLVEGRTVALGRAPSTIKCLDESDACPDDGGGQDKGCPPLPP